MKKRQIVSPNYDFNSSQKKNSYLQRKEPSSQERKIATADEKNVDRWSARSRNSEKLPRSLSCEALEKIEEQNSRREFGDFADLEKREGLEDFSGLSTVELNQQIEWNNEKEEATNRSEAGFVSDILSFKATERPRLFEKREH